MVLSELGKIVLVKGFVPHPVRAGKAVRDRSQGVSQPLAFLVPGSLIQPTGCRSGSEVISLHWLFKLSFQSTRMRGEIGGEGRALNEAKLGQHRMNQMWYKVSAPWLKLHVNFSSLLHFYRCIIFILQASVLHCMTRNSLNGLSLAMADGLCGQVWSSRPTPASPGGWGWGGGSSAAHVAGTGLSGGRVSPGRQCFH